MFDRDENAVAYCARERESQKCVILLRHKVRKGLLEVGAERRDIAMLLFS
jgi:hypothetical protein